MSFYQLSGTGSPLRRMRAAFVAAGAKSAAAGSDVDADGQLFASLCILLVAALAGRLTYVALSGFPCPAQSLAWNLGSAILFPSAAWIMGRLGFREATLVLRILMINFLAVPYAAEMCVAVFHTGRNNPFRDDFFADMDHLFAFDWLAYAHWFDAHSLVWTISMYAYRSLPVQIAAIPLVLAFSRQATRLYIYAGAQVLGLILIAAVACWLPAIGAYAHAHVHKTDFVHTFLTADTMTSSILWLRGDLSGTFGVTNFGLVSFPSYHAFCAVLLTWTAWKTRLKWPSVALNAVMLLSTPVHGSHYLGDLAAGAVVAALAIVVAKTSLHLLHKKLSAASFDRGRRTSSAALPSLP